MTPAARIQSAIELLEAIAASDRPADGVASAFLRARRFIGSKDRKAITTLVWSVLRHRARLAWRLAESALPDSARALVLAHLLLVDGQSMANLRGLFAGKEGHGPSALSSGEDKALQRLAARPLEGGDVPDAVRLEVPDWLPEALSPAFGPDTAAELAALRDEAPLDLRVNLLKTDREAARAALAGEGIAAVPTPLSPQGLRVEGRPNLAATKTFRDGLVEVQDEASQLVALLCGAAPGMAVLDLCAGAGGKTLALAAVMGNKGSLVATDTSAGRLLRAKDRLARAGVHNATRKVLDGEGNKWLKRRKGSFDVVLVDAPCSGTGTWRRNPDSRWRLGPDALPALAAEQDAILARAAALVRPGGRLVYATCSLLPQENEDRIAAFLSVHEDYRTVPVADLWPALADDEVPCPCPGPWLRLSPARHGTDGFFTAVLERATEA